MDEQVKIGDHVVFVDPLSRPRPALVTAVWGQYATGAAARAFRLVR